MKCILPLIVMVFVFSCDLSGDANRQSKSRKLAAIVDGKKIYQEQLDPRIQPEIYESIFNTFYARKLMLDELIGEQLLSEEAKKLGISVDSLINRYKYLNRTKINIDNYVKLNALEKGIPDPKTLGRIFPLGSVEGQEALMTGFENDVIYRAIETLKKEKDIQIFLHPPLPPQTNLAKVPFHKINKTSTKNTFWLFSDFQCSHCFEFYPTLRALVKKYGDKVEFRYTSLSPEVSDQYFVAEFASKHNKFGEALELIFSGTFEKKAVLAKLGLSLSEFELFCKQPTIAAEAKTNYDRLIKLGKFQATPTIVLNDRVYYGDFSQPVLEEYIVEYLQE